MTELPAQAPWRTHAHLPGVNEWAKTDHLATATHMPKTNLGRILYTDLAPKYRHVKRQDERREDPERNLAQAFLCCWAHWYCWSVVYNVAQVWYDPLVAAAPALAPSKWRTVPKTAPDDNA